MSERDKEGIVLPRRVDLDRLKGLDLSSLPDARGVSKMRMPTELIYFLAMPTQTQDGFHSKINLVLKHAKYQESEVNAFLGNFSSSKL